MTNLNLMHKYFITLCLLSLFIIHSTYASPKDIDAHIDFKQPLKRAFTVQDCNGTITASAQYGLMDEGVQFVRDGNVTTPTCKWKSRTELYAYKLQDIDNHDTRWTAFSFKVVDDSALGNKGSATIQQWWSSNGIGPKIQFYIKKDKGRLSLNLLHTIRCTYSYADQFMNSDGEQLCRTSKLEYHNGEALRKVRFESYPIEKNKWYLVRMKIKADFPHLTLTKIHNRLKQKEINIANGVIQADVKPQGGSWTPFFYDGHNGRQKYFSTFTHEADNALSERRRNHFKFGWYGKARENSYGIIQFDAIYSTSDKSGLPVQYQN